MSTLGGLYLNLKLSFPLSLSETTCHIGEFLVKKAVSKTSFNGYLFKQTKQILFFMMAISLLLEPESYCLHLNSRGQKDQLEPFLCRISIPSLLE